jgi:hypothetical protein
MVRRAVAAPPVKPLPTQPPLDLTVVVYSSRLPGLDVNGNPVGETTYPNTTFVGNNVVVIDWTTPPGATQPVPRPPLRRGSWVLDARMMDTTVNPPKPAPQGYFYRVVNVTELSATVMQLEVQQPLGGPLRPPVGPTSVGPLVVMENVSEVFERFTTY